MADKKVFEQTDKELHKQLAEMAEILRKIRFDRAVGRHGELDKMQKTRRMMAVIKTELRGRELATKKSA